MKIVITGGSGFIGKQIYPKLIEAGMEITMVGRNRDELKVNFPDSNCFDYSQLSHCFQKTDIVLHLAAINSNSEMPEEEFREVNIGLLLDVARAAKEEKVKRFINISSVHALDPKNISPYASSKRQGAKALDELNWDATENIYLPAVYGQSWAGNLAIINKCPKIVAKAIFLPIATLKPTLNVDRLVDHIVSPENPQTTSKTVILHDDKANNAIYALIKWALDFSFALFVAVFLWWLIILVWIAVRLTSKGPGLFVQTRVGKNQKPFKCYKFRTMAVGTENVGTHEVTVSSITPLGGFLRKTKIDELPQIINIFRNELSLIGPRPCLPNQHELIAEREGRGVFNVKPGITGLGQINNIDMSTPRKLAEWDARYIALRGVILDIKIIIATALGNGQGDKTKAE